jgi:Type I phosphodiesterase / nucleotide pyrophosphatase
VSRSKTVLQAFAACLGAVALFAPSAAAADKPSHVVIIVLDQARPDTITRYGMENVQELQRKGTSFPNAIVGHMAAETVISHNVLTSGLFPKDMGWSNEVYRDTDNVLAGGAGAYYVTSSMSCAQFRALIEHGGYEKLPDYLDSEFGENAKFASISQKRTSACTGGWTRAMDADDMIFQIRGSSASECGSGWRRPEYPNGTAPAYLGLTLVAGNCDNRWWTFQGAGAYGTDILSPANIYPLDGNRFVPGFDSAHIGGDNWSADAAISVIDNDPNWRGMMVSLGGIDKLGHMWGPEDQGEAGATPGSFAEIRHLPFVAKNADEQVGRIVDALETEGLLDETLIVITADHAAQTGNTFFGTLAPGVSNPTCGASTPASTGIRSDCNWYFGQDADEVYLDPSDAVADLRDALGGNLDFSYQDTQIAAFLHDNSLAKKREAAAAVLDMPGVMASYYINDDEDDYVRFGTNAMTGHERAWFVQHADELVDTMANNSAPDVVGITRTNVTYGVMGDHGGSQRLVQEIPMVFSGPGVGRKDSNRAIRHVDVLPTILKTMGIAYDPSDLDGEAVKLSKAKKKG